MSDPINPDHYKNGWSNGAEVIDIAGHLSFCAGNAVKYLTRAGRKDPSKHLEDLEKARWYVEREIRRIESEAITKAEREDVEPPAVAIEPPETITVWPDDDTALRGWRWRDREGDYWEYRGGRWKFKAHGGVWLHAHTTQFLPLTRVRRAR